jgi:Bacterial Ig domain
MKVFLLGFIVILSVISCDTIQNNDIITITGKQLPTVMTVPSGGSALIDLTIAVNSAAQVRIAQNAKNGLLNFEEGRFIRYSTKPYYVVEGIDSFVLTFDDRQLNIKVNITPSFINPTSCETGVLMDNVTTGINTPINFNVLKNDTFCNGVDLSTFHLAIPPKNGTLTGKNGLLTFTPNKDFVGTDKAIYGVSGRSATQEGGVAEIYFTINDPNTCFKMLNDDAYLCTLTAAKPSVVLDILSNDVLCNLSKSRLFIKQPPRLGTAKIENNRLVYTLTNINAGINSDFIGYGLRDSATEYNAGISIQTK